MANTRPRFVSIISWLIIISGGIGLLQSINEPQLLTKIFGPFLLALSSIINGVEVLCGLSLLKGLRLARSVYVICQIARALVFAVKMTSIGLPSLIVPGLFFDGIMVYFLYRPVAAQFFASEGNKREAN
jgi:hypothetical protein